MRAYDRTPPAYTPHPIPPGSPLSRFGAVPVILVERQPSQAYVWDDEDPAVVWDAAGDPYVWDAPASAANFIDATCDFQALEVDVGRPDDLNLFASGRCLFSLDNRSGQWSTYDAGGRLIYYAPGRRVRVLAKIGTETFWLFAGYIDRWDDTAADSVTVEAHDRFATLAQPVGKFTPGTAGETAGPRIDAIRSRAGDGDPVRLEAGTVTLTRQQTDRSPLEEIQVTALSDGGLVYTDADGTLVYRDRLWPRGRDDQPTIDRFTDNVCDADAFMVWDCQLATVDDYLATVVHLENVAGLVSEAVTDDELLLGGAPFPLTHPDPDHWTTQAEGDKLAGALLNLFGDPTVGVASMTLHLVDPLQDLWRVGIDKRLGDRIEFLHDFVAAGGLPGTFDVALVVTTVAHRVTPDAWLVELGTTQAVEATPVQRWDMTHWTWDDPLARWDH